MKHKIAMTDLWDNYSFVLHKDGEDEGKIVYAKIKDFFDGTVITGGENE